MVTNQETTDLCKYANDLTQKLIEACGDRKTALRDYLMNMHNMSAQIRFNLDHGDGYVVAKNYHRLKFAIDALNYGIPISTEDQRTETMFLAFKGAANNNNLPLCFDVWCKDGICELDNGFHMGLMEVVSERGRMLLLKPYDGDINKAVIQRYCLDVAE